MKRRWKKPVVFNGGDHTVPEDACGFTTNRQTAYDMARREVIVNTYPASHKRQRLPRGEKIVLIDHGTHWSFS